MTTPEQAEQTPTTTTTTTTDYINTVAIIGAGAAGCVLANRLLELLPTDTKILLVERGTEARPQSKAENLLNFSKGLDDYGSFADSANQQGLKNRLVSVNRGCGVGGTTLLNAGAFCVGEKQQYEFLGPPQDVERALDAIREKHQPKTSPLLATHEDCANSPAKVLIDGLQKEYPDLKLKDNEESLYTNEEGIWKILGSVKEHKDNNTAIRQSVADSFLTAEVRENPRFELLKEVMVEKILFEDNTKATGFQYKENKLFQKQLKELKGFKHIILAAGVLESPRLLMVSGVGPKEELEKCNIPLVAENNGVGQNFIDHPAIFFPLATSPDAPEPKEFPHCGPGGSTMVAYKKINDATCLVYPAGPPVVHNMHAEIMLPKFANFNLGRALQVKMLDTMRPLIHSRSDKRLGMVGMGLLHTTSRGSIKLDPNNTNQVIVDPAYLTTEEDANNLTECLQTVLKIVRDNNMSVPIPGFNLNPEDPLEAARMLAGPFWHYQGSNGQALDDTFHVIGVQNLRVVDASAFPHEMSANPQVPTMMIAYLAAEKIAQDLTTSSDA